ncbi:MAG TPA: 2-dehydropantoate 2-reductase N-terminal domain-containing protein, partial [Vicinamibacterales bacterium]|nr:2-dehydropantoate 2-reductase N-terminal domain-containing protein [Vicinamibacterales bacterium]
MSQRIGVIGSGSWGTALAVHLAHTGHDVRLWARDGALAAAMAVSRENTLYLPGVVLPAALSPTTDLAEALDGTHFVVVAVPSHGVREVARAAAPYLPDRCSIVSATKGLEAGS